MKNQKLKSYRKSWRDRWKKEKEELELRRRRAKKIARRCGALLREEYGVSSVYLVGSTVFSKKIHSRSDIDLLVRGLPDKNYFRALRDCWEVLPSDFELDLICWDNSPESLREKAQTKGELV